MFDIQFETNGEKNCTTAKVRVKTNLPCDYSNLLFEFDCSHQYATQLLVKYCQEQLQNNISNLARRCYELGWKDKSSKRKKRQYFTEFFNSYGDPAW